jgi:hypothetical protein
MPTSRPPAEVLAVNGCSCDQAHALIAQGLLGSPVIVDVERHFAGYVANGQVSDHAIARIRELLDMLAMEPERGEFRHVEELRGPQVRVPIAGSGFQPCRVDRHLDRRSRYVSVVDRKSARVLREAASNF